MKTKDEYRRIYEECIRLLNGEMDLSFTLEIDDNDPDPFIKLKIRYQDMNETPEIINIHPITEDDLDEIIRMATTLKTVYNKNK